MSRKVLLLALLAACASFFPQRAVAGDDPSGSFLVTITDSAGAFASRSVITLNNNDTVSVIDSGQEGGPVSFSSQLGTWKHAPGGVIKARTLDFSFPFGTGGIARVDYTFNAGVPGNQVQGTIVLTFFPPNGNPLGGGGSPGGTFSFSGTRITVP